jgi:catechol 2,3-dioxygenase-like lactoylglutathione lyase family enzyme
VIDHVVLNVRDYDASKRFYVAALKPLGYEVILGPTATTSRPSATNRSRSRPPG